MQAIKELKDKLFATSSNFYKKPLPNPKLEQKISEKLLDNLVNIREIADNSNDIHIKEMNISGVNIAILSCEGLVNGATLGKNLIEPLTDLVLKEPYDTNLIKWIRKYMMISQDESEIYTLDELFRFFYSGFVIILIDGIKFGFCFGLQGYQSRSISEPSSEINLRGSREGFIEVIRVNMSMIRRRLKSPSLKFELSTIGVKSKTDICLVYMNDMVSHRFLKDIKKKLDKIDIDIVLESGYITPFLENKPLSLFSGVGFTERPDTMCAKVSEGRIGILVDGTPYALIVPYLFTENFQSLDDYSHRPYYATFIRILKYICFLFTILIPGAYVAVSTFHPEVFPNSLLFNIAASQDVTPFPLIIEALIIHFIYEVMREAGLRLPRSIGHAVSIVGGLVIGDSAVRAGIIGAPMVMVLAITAITSFVVPSVYEPVAILRFSFILIGGMFGILGITLGLCVVFTNLCALSSVGIPTTSGSSPFSLYSMRDVILRLGWRTLAKKDLVIQDLPGSEFSECDGEL